MDMTDRQRRSVCREYVAADLRSCGERNPVIYRRAVEVDHQAWYRALGMPAWPDDRVTTNSEDRFVHSALAAEGEPGHPDIYKEGGEEHQEMQHGASGERITMARRQTRRRLRQSRMRATHTHSIESTGLVDKCGAGACFGHPTFI